MSYTKGPWFAGGNPCTAAEKEKAMSIFKESVDLTVEGSGYFMEVYTEDGLRTAICGHGPNGINNANLIAAAPELLEALEALVMQKHYFSPNGVGSNYCIYCDEYFTSDRHFRGGEDSDTFLNLARKAIAKARCKQ